MRIIGSQPDSTPTRTRRHTRGLMLALGVAGALCLPFGSGAQAAVGAGTTYTPPCYQTGICLYMEANGALTAWSLWNVGPTPYYYSVFNETTGARLALCGLGTSCTTAPYQGPPQNRCYTYVAYIGGSGYTNPPAPVQRTSARFTSCNQLN
jgi:hypothetical protein